MNPERPELTIKGKDGTLLLEVWQKAHTLRTAIEHKIGQSDTLDEASKLPKAFLDKRSNASLAMSNELNEID